jgi:hypothetical protein
MAYFRILLLSISVIIISCDLIVEPKRFYNNNAIPPTVRELNLDYLQNGIHIDGKIKIKANVDYSEFHASTVSIMVDDKIVHSVVPNDYLNLDTREFSEGSHVVTILVYTSERNHGMLNLIGTPSLFLQTNVIFDRTPPKSISIYALQQTNHTVLLNWEKSTNENFYAYIITRGPIQIGAGLFDTVAIIFNKDSISCIDVTLPEIYGKDYQYEATVATDQNFKFISDAYNYRSQIYYGAPKVNNVTFLSSNSKIIPNFSENEFYMLGWNEIYALDMTTYQLTKKLSLPELNYYKNFTLSDNKTKLYVFDAENNTIDIVQTQDFSLLAHQQVINDYYESPERIEIFYMQNDNLLLLCNRELFYYDTKNAFIVFREPLSYDELNIAVDKISSDKILLSQGFSDGSYKLIIRKVDEHGMPILKEQNTSLNFLYMQVDTLDKKIYGHLFDNVLRIHSLESLELLQSLEISNLLNFYVDNENLYTSQHKYISQDEGAEIICWNKNDLTQIKNYTVLNCGISEYNVFTTTNRIFLASYGMPNFPIVVVNK